MTVFEKKMKRPIVVYLNIFFIFLFLKTKKKIILRINQLKGYKNQITSFDKMKNMSFFLRKY